jgi:tRNA threonylcarbamoyladenosine biosynthesis protein TsaE
MNPMEKTLNSRAESEKFAGELLDFIRKHHDPKKAFFVRFIGDLGVGKTFLIQAIGKLLGVKENMQSPTFVLQKFYKTTDPEFKRLIHIDAYRIEKIEEADILNLDGIEADEFALVFIEWSEKIEEKIPKNGCTVAIEHLGDTNRKLTLSLYGDK